MPQPGKTNRVVSVTVDGWTLVAGIHVGPYFSRRRADCFVRLVD
jgi:hypothetical protein